MNDSFTGKKKSIPLNDDINCSIHPYFENVNMKRWGVGRERERKREGEEERQCGAERERDYNQGNISIVLFRERIQQN